MKSMTGHGRGVAEQRGRRATVEIRSVNHRYFDLKVRTGPLDAALEERVVAQVRKRAERGSFTVSVRDEGVAGAAGARVDVALARGIAAALEELRVALGLSGSVPLELVAAQPGVLQVGEAGGDPEVVAAALDAALEELVSMRRREGHTLAVDMGARLGRLREFAAEVATLAASAPEEHRKRLTERIQRLLSSTPGAPTLDEARLAQEVALLADRVDVTEELVRLRSHIDQALALIAEDAPVGRRLDFLIQELGREINTIGSKSQAAEIARRVVEAKAELEKIREQVQNVE
jgi:uncharacterized protein (TIGR00255 family)